MPALNDLYDTTLAAIDSADTLCNLARPFIQRKARRLVGTAGFTESDTPDIEQEAYIRLIERFEKAREAGNLPVLFFIKRIVQQSLANQIRERRAECRDYRRSISINRPFADWTNEDLCDILPNTSPDGRSHHWCQELMEVREAVQRLDSRERDLCVSLSIVSVAEVSQVANIPRSTVQDQVRRLRPKFKSYRTLLTA
jgi:RNA polymerase sigma factor (sigma-70 family)